MNIPDNQMAIFLDLSDLQFLFVETVPYLPLAIIEAALV
jgi:hypothetical protein